MENLIWLLIAAVIFTAVVYGAWVICQRFGEPQPVMWLVGAFFLVILLLFAAHEMGLYAGGGETLLRRH